MSKNERNLKFYQINNNSSSSSSANYNNSSSSSSSLQTFISFISIGYFGVKIIYGGFFKFYPDKFYNKSIEINQGVDDLETQDDGTDSPSKAALNAYIPNFWNNEFTDFVTLIVLSFIIFLFTNFQNKRMISSSGVISPSFFVGYLIGLGYPPLRKSMLSMSQEDVNSYYLSGGLLLVIAIMVIISNYSSQSSNKKNISIYFVTLFILIYGLYFTRKQSTSNLTTKVFTSASDKCASSTTGIIQTSGEKVNLNIPFIAFIILLLFKNDPSNDAFRLSIYFVFGLLLGILVSGVSYYGVEYFLEKTPQKKCDDIDECDIKDMAYDNKSMYQIVKQYIDKIIGNVTGYKKDTLEKTNDILEEEYANTENKKNFSSDLKKLLNEKIIPSSPLTFIDIFKRVAIGIVILLIIGLAYLIAFQRD